MWWVNEKRLKLFGASSALKFGKCLLTIFIKISTQKKSVCLYFSANSLTFISRRNNPNVWVNGWVNSTWLLCGLKPQNTSTAKRKNSIWHVQNAAQLRWKVIFPSSYKACEFMPTSWSKMLFDCPSGIIFLFTCSIGMRIKAIFLSFSTIHECDYVWHCERRKSWKSHNCNDPDNCAVNHFHALFTCYAFLH